MKSVHCVLSLVILILVSWAFYDRTVDDFGPLHVGLASGMLQGKEIPPLIFDGNMAFYPFAACVKIFTGIDDLRLPTIPMLFPSYVLLMFALLFALGKNRTVAVLLATTAVFSSTNAAGRADLWPHALGANVFILILWSVLARNAPRRGMAFVGGVGCLSMPFLSYDWALLVAAFLGFMWISSPFSSRIQYSILWKLILVVVPTLGLLVFPYLKALPHFVGARSDYLGSIAIDNLVSTIFGGGSDISREIGISISPFARLLIYAKYTVFAVLLLWFVFEAIKKLMGPANRRSRDEKMGLRASLAAGMTFFVWLVLRTGLGQSAFHVILLVVLIATPALYMWVRRSHQRAMIVGLLVVLAGVSISSVVVQQEAGLVQRDDFNYYAAAVDWQYARDNKTLLAPDYLAQNYWTLSRIRIGLDPNSVYPEDRSILLLRGEPVVWPGLIVIDERENYLQLGKWRLAKPYEHFDEQLNSHGIEARVFDDGRMIFLQSAYKSF